MKDKLHLWKMEEMPNLVNFYKNILFHGQPLQNLSIKQKLHGIIAKRFNNNTILRKFIFCSFKLLCAVENRECTDEPPSLEEGLKLMDSDIQKPI